MGTLRRTRATAPRRGPLPKLLWADLLIFDTWAPWRLGLSTHFCNKQKTNMGMKGLMRTVKRTQLRKISLEVT